MGGPQAWNLTAVIGSLNEIQGQTHSTLSRDKESNEKLGIMASCLSAASPSASRQKGSAVGVSRSLAEGDTAGNCYLIY